MDLRLVTGPSAEPVSLKEAKTHLRVDISDDDKSISAMVMAARQWAEEYTGRRFIKQTWDMWLDRFPGSRETEWWDGVREGRVSDYVGYSTHIKVPMAPVYNFQFLKTYDDAGTAFTADATTMVAAYMAEPFILSLKNAATWPTTFIRPKHGVQIRVDVGYGDASKVPAIIKHAILEYVAGLYDHRGDTDYAVPLQSVQLLNPYRLVHI